MTPEIKLCWCSPEVMFTIPVLCEPFTCLYHVVRLVITRPENNLHFFVELLTQFSWCVSYPIILVFHFQPGEKHNDHITRSRCVVKNTPSTIINHPNKTTQKPWVPWGIHHILSHDTMYIYIYNTYISINIYVYWYIYIYICILYIYIYIYICMIVWMYIIIF